MSVIAALGAGLLGGAASVFNNERNLKAQQEAQDYAKWANEVTWQREDNAVQRRVADLKAAGLSPVLAAGSSAQAGSPQKIDPAMSTDSLGFEGMMAGATRAAQTQQSIMAAQAAEAQANMLKASAGKVGIEAAIAAKELMLYGTGMEGARRHPKYENDTVRMVEMAINSITNALSGDPRDKKAAIQRAKKEGRMPRGFDIIDEERKRRYGK